MNFNLIKLLLIVSLASLAKTYSYLNEDKGEGKIGQYREYCKKYYGRFFANGEVFICLVPYAGSIPKDVKDLTDNHVIILDENLYSFNSDFKLNFSKCTMNKTDSDSINICYEEFADIIGTESKNIKPLEFNKKIVSNMLQVLKEKCEMNKGKFYSNDEEYICIVEPRETMILADDMDSLFMSKAFIYKDQYYTLNNRYSFINYDEYYDYYSKIAKLLNVNIDTLVPVKSFDDAFKDYIKFEQDMCDLTYKKDNSYVCFSYHLISENHDINYLRSKNIIVKNGRFYYLTSSSFRCDSKCYDKIAAVMNEDVDSIIPKENVKTILDDKKGCTNESDLLYDEYNGKEYVCLHKYQDETEIPENSVCILENENIIKCVNDKYTESESCIKDNDKYDYETCYNIIKKIINYKTISRYPPNIQSTISIKTSKTLPTAYGPKPSSYPSDGNYYVKPKSDDPVIGFYITIGESSKAIDKQTLLEIVNDRMNDIYEIILRNQDKYRYLNNDAINNELDQTYPEGKKILFVNELSQGTTSDDFIQIKSNLIKVGNYIDEEEDGCNSSSGCYAIYAYLTKNMLKEVTEVSNINKVKESDVYAKVYIKDDKAPVTSASKRVLSLMYSTKTKTLPNTKTSSVKIIVEPTPTITFTKQILTTTSTKQFPTTATTRASKRVQSLMHSTKTKTLPNTKTSSVEIIVEPTPTITFTKQILTTTTTTSTKQIPTSASTKTIPTKTIPTSTSTKTIPTKTSTKTIPTNTSTKTILVSTNCLPVTITVKEIDTVTVKETVTVTIGGEPTNEPTNCVPKWGQCGGIGYSGPTCCQSGSTCHKLGPYYSQCN